MSSITYYVFITGIIAIRSTYDLPLNKSPRVEDPDLALLNLKVIELQGTLASRENELQQATTYIDDLRSKSQSLIDQSTYNLFDCTTSRFAEDIIQSLNFEKCKSSSDSIIDTINLSMNMKALKNHKDKAKHSFLT